MKKVTRLWIAALAIAILAVVLLACCPVGRANKDEPVSTLVVSQPTAEAPAAATPTAAPAEAETPATPAEAETPATPEQTPPKRSIEDIVSLLSTKPSPPQPEEPTGPSADDTWTLPFRDDFSDPTSGWHILRDEAGISDYENGGFRMRVDKENWLVYSGIPLLATDVFIEVDAENIGGIDDNSFGVYCRGKGENYYYMEITSDGFYKIAKFVDDEYFKIVPWAETSVIRPGRAVNHIRAECIGNTLALYANGTLLAQAQDNELSSGYIGLMAGSFDTPGVDILFDNFVAVGPGGGSQRSPTPGGEPSFGPIVICEDVTDDGEPINPSNEFPSGTTTVWAYFTYENMEDGQPWGGLWEQDGEVYVDARDELWEDGPSGWLGYYISDDYPLSGHFALTLYIGDKPVQEASFYVAPPVAVDLGDSAAFGAIKFAKGVTDESVPIGVGSEFEAGITEAYAVFAYMNMTEGQSWAREWLYEGEVLVQTDVVWDEGREGLTYYYYSDEDGLEPGQYTLNLYIDGQLARSADFEVVGPADQPDVPRGPANPEDIIDPELMPAWEMLATANPEILREVAEFALRHHIEIRIDDSYSGLAAYRAACDRSNPQPGNVVVSRRYWNDHSWEEVTATLGHELTHAVQHMNGGKCECTIEKEYYAYVTQFYVLQELDRMDLLEEKYRGVYDQNGKFGRDRLWAALKKTYSDCSEY